MSAQAVYTLPIAPEYINPNVGGGTPFISNVQHLSNYHMEDVEFYSKSPNEDSVYSDINNLYVWTWGAINSPFVPCSGIGWKRTDVGGTILNDGFIILDKLVWEPEIAFIKDDNGILIFLAYFRPDEYSNPPAPGPNQYGFFYDIYRWHTTSITPVSLNNYLITPVFMGEKKYARISIDAINLEKLAIIWEGPENSIYAKLFQTVGGVLSTTADTYGFPIAGVPGYPIKAKMPDVALSRVGDITKIRVAYLQNTALPPSVYQDIYTINCDWNSLFAGMSTIPWNLDDHNSSDPMPHAFNYTFGMDGGSFQLDCPDNTPEDRWSYFYAINGTILKSRIKRPSVAPITVPDIALFLPLYGKHTLSISYDRDFRMIHYGWYDPAAGDGKVHYLSVQYREDGAKIGAPNAYKIIQNPPYNFATYQALSFSKHNQSKQIFASYMMNYEGPFVGVGGMIRHKNIDWTSLSQFSEKTEMIMDMGFDVYPNPFSGGNISIDIPHIESQYLHQISLIDIHGKVYWHYSGTEKNKIINDIQTVAERLAHGNYLIRYSNTRDNMLYVKKITKI